MILPKRFDIFLSLTGGRSEGLDALRFFFKHMIPSERFDIFTPVWDASEGLDAFRFFFKKQLSSLFCDGRSLLPPLSIINIYFKKMFT